MVRIKGSRVHAPWLRAQVRIGALIRNNDCTSRWMSIDDKSLITPFCQRNARGLKDSSKEGPPTWLPVIIEPPHPGYSRTAVVFPHPSGPAESASVTVASFSPSRAMVFHEIESGIRI